MKRDGNGGGEGTGSNLRERTFEFACAVLDLHRYLYRGFPDLRVPSSQVVRAAGSVGANLEEADAAQSRADFISKCNISLKEARESRYWLRVLHRTSKNAQFVPLLDEATELIAILTTIVRKSRQK